MLFSVLGKLVIVLKLSLLVIILLVSGVLDVKFFYCMLYFMFWYLLVCGRYLLSRCSLWINRLLVV